MQVQHALPACPLRLWPGWTSTSWIPLRGFIYSCIKSSSPRLRPGAIARISHQADLGSQIMLANSAHWLHRAGLPCEQPVLFGSWPTLALHLDRSPLRHSYSYASAGDRPICFARATQNSESRREIRANPLPRRGRGDPLSGWALALGHSGFDGVCVKHTAGGVAKDQKGRRDTG